MAHAEGKVDKLVRNPRISKVSRITFHDQVEMGRRHNCHLTISNIHRERRREKEGREGERRGGEREREREKGKRGERSPLAS